MDPGDSISFPKAAMVDLGMVRDSSMRTHENCDYAWKYNEFLNEKYNEVLDGNTRKCDSVCIVVCICVCIFVCIFVCTFVCIFVCIFASIFLQHYRIHFI